jgi:hypothetical protein
MTIWSFIKNIAAPALSGAIAGAAVFLVPLLIPALAICPGCAVAAATVLQGAAIGAIGGVVLHNAASVIDKAAPVVVNTVVNGVQNSVEGVLSAVEVFRNEIARLVNDFCINYSLQKKKEEVSLFKQ